MDNWIIVAGLVIVLMVVLAQSKQQASEDPEQDSKQQQNPDPQKIVTQKSLRNPRTCYSCFSNNPYKLYYQITKNALISMGTSLPNSSYDNECSDLPLSLFGPRAIKCQKSSFF